jgi:hypothetical protein
MKTDTPPAPAAGRAAATYPMAPLIRGTLVGLYLALAAPLPWLAPSPLKPGLWLALILGLLLVVSITSEQVNIDADGIRVGHPNWCAWALRRGWHLPWSAITAITPVSTSQGGRVFYLRSGEQAWLLPQRIAGFEEFLERFKQESGLDISGIGRISPPWTYQLLAGLTGLMVLGELAWGISCATGN